MTNEDLIPYIHPLTIVLKTLGRVEQKITYGGAAKIVGLWDGKGKLNWTRASGPSEAGS